MPTVDLDALRKSHTWSEAYRHECEVKHICSLRTSNARHDYIARIKQKRGKDAADRLHGDARRLWEKTHGSGR